MESSCDEEVKKLLKVREPRFFSMQTTQRRPMSYPLMSKLRREVEVEVPPKKKAKLESGSSSSSSSADSEDEDEDEDADEDEHEEEESQEIEEDSKDSNECEETEVPLPGPSYSPCKLYEPERTDYGPPTVAYIVISDDSDTEGENPAEKKQEK